MRRLYTLLVTLLLPFAVVRLLWRGVRVPAYRRRIGERFGHFSPPRQPGGIWIHAVSVGEVQAVEPLVRRLLKAYPQMPITLTTTTPTGSARVGALFGEQLFHRYFPYDAPWVVNRFFQRLQPRMLVLVETEIWPNLLAAARTRGVYTLLANARLSQRSAQRYARLGAFSRQVFGQIDQVAAQNEDDADRFRQLGVPDERLRVTGSIKFDITLPASLHERAELLKVQWAGRPVWVAASTHEGEDELVITAHRQLLQTLPGALLVLVPRHPERFERVAALCEREGLPARRRSRGETVDPESRILLGDTMGEVNLFLTAADAAFVGGSLVPHGGHNVLEPAASGIPVAFGPHVHNFAVITELLLERDAARQVRDAGELADCISHWLGDASDRTRMGENGRLFVEENRGALDRLCQLVIEQLEAKEVTPGGR